MSGYTELDRMRLRLIWLKLTDADPLVIDSLKEDIEKLEAATDAAIAALDTTIITQYASDRVAYCDWFRCEKCGCCDVMETFKFCPECGRKIE